MRRVMYGKMLGLYPEAASRNEESIEVERERNGRLALWLKAQQQLAAIPHAL